MRLIRYVPAVNVLFPITKSKGTVAMVMSRESAIAVPRLASVRRSANKYFTMFFLSNYFSLTATSGFLFLISETADFFATFLRNSETTRNKNRAAAVCYWWIRTLSSSDLAGLADDARFSSARPRREPSLSICEERHDAFGNKDACVPVRTPEVIFISAQAS